MNNLLLLCKQFRCAILKCPINKLPFSMKQFPSGACGDTSLLLAEFLKFRGFSGFEYVCGWKNSRSHAWLEKDNLIIDITADQFDSHMPGVIVTTNRDFHKHFVISQRNEANLEMYDSQSRAELYYAYLQISLYLNVH